MHPNFISKEICYIKDDYYIKIWEHTSWSLRYLNYPFLKVCSNIFPVALIAHGITVLDSKTRKLSILLG